jgi:hypothetical protein
MLGFETIFLICVLNFEPKIEEFVLKKKPKMPEVVNILSEMTQAPSTDDKRGTTLSERVRMWSSKVRDPSVRCCEQDHCYHRGHSPKKINIKNNCEKK